jgi:hypothetical protein
MLWCGKRSWRGTGQGAVVDVRTHGVLLELVQPRPWPGADPVPRCWCRRDLYEQQRIGDNVWGNLDVSRLGTGPDINEERTKEK